MTDYIQFQSPVLARHVVDLLTPQLSWFWRRMGWATWALSGVRETYHYFSFPAPRVCQGSMFYTYFSSSKINRPGIRNGVPFIELHSTQSEFLVTVSLFGILRTPRGSRPVPASSRENYNNNNLCHHRHQRYKHIFGFLRCRAAHSDPNAIMLSHFLYMQNGHGHAQHVVQ